MAARLAKGMFLASGAANKTMTSKVAACTSPETGVVPPLSILLTVRAIVQVAGMPPKNGIVKLAMP